jgi:integrase
MRCVRALRRNSFRCQRATDGLWVFQISKSGKRVTEYFAAKDKEDATKQAKEIRERIFGEFARNEHLPPTLSTTSVKQLLDLYVEHLRANTKTAENTVLVLNAHLYPAFGPRKASSLTTQDFKNYRKDRLKKGGVSDTTVNRELSYLRAAFYNGKKQTPSLVGEVPFFPIVKEENIRQGFLEVKGYESLLAELPESLKCLFVVAYHVGNRKGELLKIKWPQVELSEGFIVLRTGQTKNDQGRHLPIYGDMREWLVKQKAFRDVNFPKSDCVFFWYPQDVSVGHGGSRVAPGSQIKDFDASWKAACTRAGCEDLLFHDLRRSAVRNMIQKAGIPEVQAMTISGHKTRAMLTRYNIVSRDDVQDAGKKLDGWMSTQRSNA